MSLAGRRCWALRRQLCSPVTSAYLSRFISASATSSLSSSSSAAEAEVAAEADAATHVGFEKTRSGGLLGWLKTGILISVTAALAGTSYVTYAYTGEELDKQLTQLRTSLQQKSASDENVLTRVQNSLYQSALQAVVGVADAYLDARKSLEDQVRGFAAPSSDKLLPDLQPHEQHVMTLVLDLNETLVFSDWKRDRGWRTFKRPGVEDFLEQLAQYYELVIYSDQLVPYVDPILNQLDQKGYVRYRLYRDATQYVRGKHLRDLSKLNRDPAHVIYLSGHAMESCLQPENSLPVKAWTLEGEDTCLLDLLPFLEFVARQRPTDIRPVLAHYQGRDVAAEFRERTKEYQRKMQERKQQSRLWRGSVSRTSQQ